MYAEKQNALRIFKSKRFIELINQALYHTIKNLESVEPELQETGNLQDLRALRTHLFNQYADELFEQMTPKHREVLIRLHKGGDFNEA